MKAIAAYMAYKSGQQRGGDGGRRSEYNETGMREYDNRRSEYREPGMREYGPNRSEYGAAESRIYNDERQPNQYTARNAMDEEPTEAIEMRRRRDSRGRYMMDEDMPPEDRYRGRDGRWKAGRRRSEYEGGASDNYPADRRMDGYEEEEELERKEIERKKLLEPIHPKNVIPWPYMPNVPPVAPESRMIGFGNRPKEYETRSHYGHEYMHEAPSAGKTWVDEEEIPVMDRETAEKWVKSMKNEDNVRPLGGRWSMEEIKPMAQKMGFKPDPDDDEFIEFWAMTNAMYSDYCEVAKKFNVSNPEFFGMMAKAWIDDKDAMPDKTALYYKYCVKK